CGGGEPAANGVKRLAGAAGLLRISGLRKRREARRAGTGPHGAPSRDGTGGAGQRLARWRDAGALSRRSNGAGNGVPAAGAGAGVDRSYSYPSVTGRSNTTSKVVP